MGLSMRSLAVTRPILGLDEQRHEVGQVEQPIGHAVAVAGETRRDV
jgi:hypothetical protein